MYKLPFSDLTGIGAESFETAEQRACAAEQNVSVTSSRHDALEATINAAEKYMQALRLAPSSTEKARIDSKCKELMTKAEILKQRRVSPRRGDGVVASLSPSKAGLTQPILKRKLTTREEIILLEGSKLNGFVFPPWAGNPQPEEFTLEEGQAPFTDSPLLRLSPMQQETFAGWKRPWEALTGINTRHDDLKLPTQPTMQRMKKVDLVQDMTSDCSVVASLCAISVRAERGHPTILSSVIFPYDHKNLRPAISPSSKYILRLHFNGCFRKVVVDDRLPSSTDSRVFHVVDRCNPGYLWPALVEKAYLKVRGGYDFPGSNSGTDLAALTGWLPEQVFLHDGDVMPEELWSRVFRAFSYGDVLLTIGTGKLSRREQRHLGLAAEHDYAILDMREVDGTRELLIKNPWSEGGIWRGRSRRTPSPNHAKEEHPFGSVEELSTNVETETMAPGTFWMDLGSTLQHFQNLYLNWNPGLFSHRQDFHFSWDLSLHQPMTGSFETNPQFCVRCSQDGPLWLLLNRHFQTGDYQATNNVSHGFIGLYLFNKEGQRVLLSDSAMIRGPYVDSPNTLVKLEAQAGTGYTVVVASQDLPSKKLNFTLSALSRCLTELSLARKRYLSVTSMIAAWTRSTAGGNSESPTYLKNPQFALHMPSKSKIAVVLGSIQSVTQVELAVHVKVFFSKGLRLTALRRRDIAAQSGDYRRGSAAVETTLEPGTYTIVCSTFSAGQVGDFRLSVQSSSDTPPRVQPLYAEGSGRFTTVSEPAIFEASTNRLLAPMTAPRLTRASLVVQPLKNADRGTVGPLTFSPLKVTLELGQGPYKTCIATSSASEELEYDDPVTGVRIENVDLYPEMYGTGTGGLWVVLQRIAGSGATRQKSETFQVLAMAEERVSIGAWGLGEG